MNSLFAPLRAEGLTTLHVRHDWRTGQVLALAAREWSPDRDFAAYRRDFDHESLLCPGGRRLDAKATKALYVEHGTVGALDDLFGLLRAGGHQGVDLWLHEQTDLRVLSNMHSNRLGIANGYHALRAGGIRRHGRDESEREVVVDGLNLARAMSYKNAAAKIPFGGSKICVVADPIALEDLERIGFLGYCIDRARCFTGPDMGFDPEHADVLRTHFTRNIVGGPAGALGPTGAPTARGVALAIAEVAQHHLGRANLEGTSVAVQGLGAVGGPLADALLASGVGRLLVAEPCKARREAWLAACRTPELVEVVEVESVLRAEVDIVSPNAVGGVLDEQSIDELRCKVVMGAANNQLAAVTKEEELALADRLAARGVLYQIDWMHNTAGVIAGFEEWMHQGDARQARVEAHLARVCGEGVRRNLEAARTAGITPTAAAYRGVEAKIYPGSG